MINDNQTTEHSPLLQQHDEEKLDKATWLACNNSCCNFTKDKLIPSAARITWMATIAGGCYLSYEGGKQGIELFTDSEIKYLVGAISATINFQVLHRSQISVDEFKKNFLPGLLFGLGYSFTSGLLTYKQAPAGIQKWIFGALNGVSNVPFSFESTNNMIVNISEHKKQWSLADKKTKAILFFNFAIIFLIVSCSLIGFAAPVVELFISWVGKSFATYLASGAICAILNCIDLFFQINEMICLKTSENCRPILGYLRNPFPDDAWQHKFRSALSLIFAFIQAISFGTFSYNIMLPASQPLAIAIGVTALIGPTWYGIKSADAFVAQPVTNSLNYVANTIYATIPASWKTTVSGLFCTCPPKLPCFTHRDMVKL